MKLNLQTVSFAADAMRMLNGARLSVNGLYSITGVDWLIAAGIIFSSRTALRFADLKGLPSNNTMDPVNARPLQDGKWAFTKITPRAVFALSAGYAQLPDGLKFVYAMVALLSEGKYDVIISAANRGIEIENLRPLRAELPAV